MTTGVGAASLAETQLELLRRMAALDPAPCVIGGYAEDALLAGTVTRPHVDIDWLVPRRELPLRLAQGRKLGFGEFETWGESAPGDPFYLYSENGELKLELGVADEQDGRVYLRIHSLAFDIDGRKAPAGYQLLLPRDTFEHPPVELDGVMVRTASPLALYQLRIGIASQGSFGPLSPQQRESAGLLKERFFPLHPDADLEPRIEPARSAPNPLEVPPPRASDSAGTGARTVASDEKREYSRAG
jgi:hypothetical protein